MKILPCLAAKDNIDHAYLKSGYPMEVEHIPKIGEHIKIKMNLFDFIFRNIHPDYKNNIVFHNHIIVGTVIDIVHDFHVVSKEKSRLFPGKKHKPDFCSGIQSEDQVEVIQTVFVVIDFTNHG